MRTAKNLLLPLCVAVVDFKAHYISPWRHDAAHSPVRKLEHPFHNLLLHGFEHTRLCSLAKQPSQVILGRQGTSDEHVA